MRRFKRRHREGTDWATDGRCAAVTSMAGAKEERTEVRGCGTIESRVQKVNENARSE